MPDPEPEPEPESGVCVSFRSASLRAPLGAPAPAETRDLTSRLATWLDESAPSGGRPLCRVRRETSVVSSASRARFKTRATRGSRELTRTVVSSFSPRPRSSRFVFVAIARTKALPTGSVSAFSSMGNPEILAVARSRSSPSLTHFSASASVSSSSSPSSKRTRHTTAQSCASGPFFSEPEETFGTVPTNAARVLMMTPSRNTPFCGSFRFTRSMLFLLFSRRATGSAARGTGNHLRTLAPTHRAEASAASVRAARCASSEGGRKHDKGEPCSSSSPATASASASRRSASRLSRSARARSSAAAARRLTAPSSTSARAVVGTVGTDGEVLKPAAWFDSSDAVSAISVPRGDDETFVSSRTTTAGASASASSSSRVFFFSATSSRLLCFVATTVFRRAQSFVPGFVASAWSARNCVSSSKASSGVHRSVESTQGAAVLMSSNRASHSGSTLRSASNKPSTASTFASCPAVALAFFSSFKSARASSSWQSTTHGTVRHMDAAHTRYAHMSAW